MDETVAQLTRQELDELAALSEEQRKELKTMVERALSINALDDEPLFVALALGSYLTGPSYIRKLSFVEFQTLYGHAYDNGRVAGRLRAEAEQAK